MSILNINYEESIKLLLDRPVTQFHTGIYGIKNRTSYIKLTSVNDLPFSTNRSFSKDSCFPRNYFQQRIFTVKIFTAAHFYSENFSTVPLKTVMRVTQRLCSSGKRTTRQPLKRQLKPRQSTLR